MEPTENRPESRTPGLIGLGLLVALAIGFGLGQKFAADGGEPERLPAPPAPSIFQLPSKLVVYQEGPAIPALWLDTFSSGSGNPKIDLRVLERGSDGSWPSDGDVYLIKARTFQPLSQIFSWADLTGRVPLEGINPVFQGQAFDPTGVKSRPWRISPWFFMKKVAPGTPHKVALAAPARWAGEPQSLFPSDPDLMGAIVRNSRLTWRRHASSTGVTEYDAIPDWAYNWPDYRGPHENLVEKGLIKIKAEMTLLAQELKKLGVPLTLVVYPWPQQVKAGTKPSRSETEWASWAKGNGVQFINLFPVFVNQEPAEQVIQKYYWKNDAHWNEEGHRLVAEALLRPEGGILLPRKNTVESKTQPRK